MSKSPSVRKIKCQRDHKSRVHASRDHKSICRTMWYITSKKFWMQEMFFTGAGPGVKSKSFENVKMYLETSWRKVCSSCFSSPELWREAEKQELVLLLFLLVSSCTSLLLLLPVLSSYLSSKRILKVVCYASSNALATLLLHISTCGSIGKMEILLLCVRHHFDRISSWRFGSAAVLNSIVIMGNL